MTLKIKFKALVDNAWIPTKTHMDDAGWDLYSPFHYTLTPGIAARLTLGIASEFPPGHVMIIKDRSSLAAKGIHVLGGVIDSGYRGEWSVVLINFGQDLYHFSPGDRLAQVLLLSLPSCEVLQTPTLLDSSRGSGGFGSTGV